MSGTERAPYFVPDRTTIKILSALARGISTADAASSCHVSESTLRRKLAHARQQWGVESNIQLVVMAVRRGLI